MTNNKHPIQVPFLANHTADVAYFLKKAFRWESANIEMFRIFIKYYISNIHI